MRRLLVGEVPGRGVVVEGVKGVKYAPCRLKYMKTAKKFMVSPHFLAYKSLKTRFFAQKSLTRYSPKTFLEEYIYFKIFHDLSHFGVIPVQRF